MKLGIFQENLKLALYHNFIKSLRIPQPDFMQARCFSLFSFLFLFGMSSTSAQPQWKLKTDQDGVQVYMQTGGSSAFKPVKTVTVVTASLTRVAAVLLDVMRTPEWVYGTKSCSILKQESPNAVYYYAEIAMPWPVKNRDFIIKITMSQQEQTRVITVLAENKPDYLPAKSNLVRIQHSAGKWTITPLPDGKVKIEYVLEVDPGGMLPASIVNMFSYDGPFKSFKRLQERADLAVYANAKFGFIKD